ncbi:MAG TPA: porphobilinogen synthase [Deltaproteobacteria bacterium]|nr:MAG: delta-aminolevulinic acid dehydratase [Omnitrophica bacterium GWA2_41_15]HBR18523.1 porphobilinogen synthase [Deltaproteobacteria bacterium]
MAAIKLRRLRRNSLIRGIVSQTRISASDFVMPYFAVAGRNKKETIESIPGFYRLSIENLVKDIEETRGLGINSAFLFGIPVKKDEYGKEAYNEDGVVQRAIKAIRKDIGDIVIITDVCLCGYTSHGHCGIVKRPKTKNKDFYIDNDETLKILSKIAISHAEAGVDFVAPSAMMDGQVRAIREALDKNGFQDTGILAYSAKYASNFYGPFREALDSTPEFGDRKTYQMDYRNADEALREIQEDINEGADIVMVKPSLAYLDIIYRAKEKFNIPLAAYNVSGEYSAIKKLSQGDKVKEKDLALEVLTSIKRAGADIIITYYAKEAVRWLK